MLNKAIDNGNYEIPIEDVRKAASEFRVMSLIREEIPTHYLLDLSMFTPEDEEAINRWFYGTNGNHDIHVENKGLCLLLAWTIEMMQTAEGPENPSSRCSSPGAPRKSLQARTRGLCGRTDEVPGRPVSTPTRSSRQRFRRCMLCLFLILLSYRGYPDGG
jgi:hypothetical protein